MKKFMVRTVQHERDITDEIEADIAEVAGLTNTVRFIDTQGNLVVTYSLHNVVWWSQKR